MSNDACPFQVPLRDSGYFCRHPRVHATGQLVSAEICASCTQRNDGESAMRPVPTELPSSLPIMEPPIGFGPGTELKKLLAWWGFAPCGTCQAQANEMDRMGCDWCSQNEGTIIGWLREEAGRRKIPFVELAAKMVVRRAIHTARHLHGCPAS